MEADPAGINAKRKMVIKAIATKPAKWGSSLSPTFASLAEDGVVVDGVVVGVAVEAFDEKIAASGEVGDRPRSSVQINSRQNAKL